MFTEGNKVNEERCARVGAWCAAGHLSRFSFSFSFSRSGEEENDYEKENDSIAPFGSG